MAVRVSAFAVVLVALAAGGTGSAQPAPAPYDFRGARLGMSVDEFRALSYPDESAYLRARVVCSGDPEITSENSIRIFGDLLLAPHERSLGIVKCSYFQSSTHTYPGTNRSFTTWLRAGVIAGSYAGNFTYSFAPPAGGGSPALYEILSTDIRIGGLSRLIEGLRERFGPPISDTSDTMQVRSGAVFPRRALSWENGRDAITLVAPGVTSDLMTLAYRRVEHAKSVTDAIKEAVGSPASRL